jgi:hypothetical protein
MVTCAAILIALSLVTQFGAREDFTASLDDVAEQSEQDPQMSEPPGFPATEAFTTPPSVTIHTLTSAKRRHLDKNLFLNWKRSTYPGKLELLIYDQSPEPSQYLQEQAKASLGATDTRKMTYVFRDVTAEGSVVTGASRNYLLSRTDGDIIVLMDSDDFYFPSYVSYMVEGLLSQRVIYFGLLGYYCTKIKEGKVDGIGFSTNIGRAPQHYDVPTIGFGLAFFTMMRGWTGVMGDYVIQPLLPHLLSPPH